MPREGSRSKVECTRKLPFSWRTASIDRGDLAEVCVFEGAIGISEIWMIE
jgi:hypothetical protein